MTLIEGRGCPRPHKKKKSRKHNSWRRPQNNSCPHGRQRSQCKECGGAGICEHGRVRSRCKECGGGATRSKRARKAPVPVVQAEPATDEEEETGPSASAARRGRKAPMLVIQAELATDEEEEAGPSASAARRGRRVADPAAKRRRVGSSSSDEAEYEEGAWESGPISRGADVDVDVDVIDGFVFTSSTLEHAHATGGGGVQSRTKAPSKLPGSAAARAAAACGGDWSVALGYY